MIHHSGLFSHSNVYNIVQKYFTFQKIQNLIQNSIQKLRYWPKRIGVLKVMILMLHKILSILLFRLAYIINAFVIDDCRNAIVPLFLENR